MAEMFSEMEKMREPSGRADSNEVADVRSVIGHLLRHPIRSFIVNWNWKAAALSGILRVPVYVITTLKFGWQAATLAGAVEAVFTAVAAGVYAAFTEAVRDAEPQSLVAFLLLVVLPAITLAFDALVHYVMATPNLRAGVTASFVLSGLSSAFSWYSMRRGTLLVGSDARPFASDLVRLPMLVLRFISEPFVLLWRTLKQLCLADM